MTPQHDLFRELFQIFPIIGQTFDYLPPEKTEYPFIYIGESYDSERAMNDLVGQLTQTVHIYGLVTQRMILEEMAGKIHNYASAIKTTENYSVAMTNFRYQVIPDNTDVQPLLHYAIDLQYTYNKKGETYTWQ